MKDFWIDFSGSLRISAESEEEAKEKFWDYISDCKYVEINDIEEISENN